MRQLTSKQIKQTEITILKNVHQFCIENNLRYFLTGGSLIGAVRHNGFIPWDDDIDIVMFRDDYEKFLEEFNKKNDEYKVFSLNDSGYNYPFAKICDMKTLLIEENIAVHNVEIGVFVDLFPLDKFPVNVNENKLLKKLHFWDKVLYCKSFRMEKLKTKKFLNRIVILFYKIAFALFSKKTVCKKLSGISQSFNHKETQRYGLITSAIISNIPSLNYNTKQILHNFEEEKFYIPDSYDKYLKIQFGDYMCLPPIEKRKSGHAFVAFRK